MVLQDELNVRHRVDRDIASLPVELGDLETHEGKLDPSVDSLQRVVNSNAFVQIDVIAEQLLLSILLPHQDAGIDPLDHSAVQIFVKLNLLLGNTPSRSDPTRTAYLISVKNVFVEIRGSSPRLQMASQLSEFLSPCPSPLAVRRPTDSEDR